MTIGIGTAGPRAGLAAFRALQAVEAVSRGMIHGFVSLATLTADGRLLRAETQRGGTSTLFIRDEATGVEPPDEIADSVAAVLMSSGPDRTLPLSQFTPGDPALGLVSGHRLPNLPGADGTVMFAALLARLAEGHGAEEALSLTLAADPNADAGLIVVACDGTIVSGNTALVARRDDGGAARGKAAGLSVHVLHNAIFPVRGIAELAVAAALDVADPADRWDATLTLRAGLMLERGPSEGVAIDREDHVATVIVDRDGWLGPYWEGAPIRRGARVLRDGHPVAVTVSEAYCTASGGRLVTVSSGPVGHLRIRYIR